jgi:glycerol-3-phosphate responsive antiterminator
MPATLTMALQGLTLECWRQQAKAELLNADCVDVLPGCLVGVLIKHLHTSHPAAAAELYCFGELM